jgi:DNA-binding CsgD family transcriptional regulator
VGAEPSFGLEAALECLGTELAPALAEIPLPAYVLASDLRVVWANEQIEALLGPITGRNALDFVAPESRQRAREQAVAKVLTGKPSHYEISLLDRKGRRIPVEISSVALRHGASFVGVFGLVSPPGDFEPKAPPALEPRLTPRQHDVLRLLGHGASTAQIAKTLGIREETARNHIRALLKRLRQPSRVAAVAHARRHGLL